MDDGADTSTPDVKLCAADGCTNPTRTPRSKYCEDHAHGRFPKPDSSNATAGALHRRATDIQEQLTVNLQMAAQLWSMSDEQCASVLYNQAPAIAEFWAQRAAQSSRVASALEGITAANGWLGGIAVHAPLAMVLFQHHVQPQIEARRAAMQQAPEEGTRATDPGSGVTYEFRDGDWHALADESEGVKTPDPAQNGDVSDEPGTIHYTGPKSQRDAEGLPEVDRYGHRPTDAGTPRDDAGDDFSG